MKNVKIIRGHRYLSKYDDRIWRVFNTRSISYEYEGKSKLKGMKILKNK